MREIKFRAWDKTNKMYFRECEWVAFYPSGIKFYWVDDDSDEMMHTELKEGEFELLQFTGLKDKNEKPIYEGDIAKITWEEGTYRGSAYNGALNYTELGVMEFNSDNAQFSFFINDSLLDDTMQNLIIEVIGNIYENPELLEDK